MLRKRTRSLKAISLPPLEEEVILTSSSDNIPVGHIPCRRRNSMKDLGDYVNEIRLLRRENEKITKELKAMKWLNWRYDVTLAEVIQLRRKNGEHELTIARLENNVTALKQQLTRSQENIDHYDMQEQTRHRRLLRNMTSF